MDLTCPNDKHIVTNKNLSMPLNSPFDVDPRILFILFIYILLCRDVLLDPVVVLYQSRLEEITCSHGVSSLLRHALIQSH